MEEWLPSYYKQGHKPLAEINVVPYIDVMLVLLIVFMATAPLLSSGVNIDLPEASAQPLQHSEDPIIIGITDKGRYHADVIAGGKEVTLQDIERAMQKILNNRSQIQVLIEGDREVSYQYIVQLLGMLQSIGVTRLGLITEPEQVLKESK